MEQLALAQAVVQSGPAVIFMLISLLLWRSLERSQAAHHASIQAHMADLRKLAGLDNALLRQLPA